MAKGVRIPWAELDVMLSTYKRQVGSRPRMEIYQELYELFEGKYHVNSIASAIARYQPTTELATVILKKGAMRLASRVVRRANVTEAIDVLSRPNIGVLDPIKKTEGGGGFIISVTAESCGTVKVGAAFNPLTDHPQLGPTQAQINAKQDVIITSHRVEEVEDGVSEGKSAVSYVDGAVSGNQGLFAKALERSRARLEAAKRREGVGRGGRSGAEPGEYQGDEGLQELDGQLEG